MAGVDRLDALCAAASEATDWLRVAMRFCHGHVSVIGPDNIVYSTTHGDAGREAMVARMIARACDALGSVTRKA